MAGKDYYQILGIPKTASAEEIKKAYRRLAMKHHPDRNKGDKTAEARFKDISEAYAVMSNAEKRKQYDMFGAEGFERRFTQEDIFRDFDLGSIFREFGFGGRGGRGSTIFTQAFGGMGQERFRGSPFESAFRGHGGPQPARGRDLIYELTLTLEEAATATQKTVTYQDDGRQQTVSVKVPAGISTGKKLRLTGKGQAGIHGGPQGDLYVQIRVLDHPVFRREGDDLILERAIRFSDAVSGTEIEVPTIQQKTLRLKIPPGTQCNAKFRMKGYGMPHMDGSGRGDAFVQISIAVPEKLNRKQKALLKEMEEAGF
ncbi:MAG: DnaJ C-terminal domain-containing protein [Thermodesulfobacteriota bacterium]